jgi:hypothetical protein
LGGAGEVHGGVLDPSGLWCTLAAEESLTPVEPGKRVVLPVEGGELEPDARVEAVVVVGVLVAPAIAGFLRRRARVVSWEPGLRRIPEASPSAVVAALPWWVFSTRIRARLRALICSLFSYADACSGRTLDEIVGS